MALKAKLPNLNGLAEAVKAEYKQAEDGSYVLDVEAVDGLALEDISGLKSTVGKQKTTISELKTLLKGFEVDGQVVDPAAALAALSKIKELGNLTPEQLAETKVKSALEQAQTQFGKQIGAKDTEIAALTKHLETALIDQAATAAIVAKGGNVKLLLPHVKTNVKLVRDDRGFHVQVVDAEGNGRIHVAQGKTSDMTVEQFIDEMSGSTDYAAAFAAPGKPGGGTTVPNRQGTGGQRVIRASDNAAVNGSIADIASGKVQVDLA